MNLSKFIVTELEAILMEWEKFARTILPYLVHVHLKDYRMTPSPEGYRIFHCAIGAGVVDYPALFDLFRTKDDLVCNLEMAALGERHIRLLTGEYWAGHTHRPVADVLPLLRLLCLGRAC